MTTYFEHFHLCVCLILKILFVNQKNEAFLGGSQRRGDAAVRNALCVPLAVGAARDARRDARHQHPLHHGHVQEAAG